MSLTRNNLAIMLAACALTIAGGGCQTPWLAGPDPLSRESGAEPVATGVETTNTPPRGGSVGTAAVATTPSSAPTNDRPPQSVSEPDLAGVMDKVRQVGEIDPSAQQKLMAELQQTDPKFWPAAAEHFRASLAYHKELAAKPSRLTRENEMVGAHEQLPIFGSADFGELPSTGSGSELVEDSRAGASPSQMSAASSHPSTRIGGLPDPRHADADGVSNEALAQATPYSNRLPPDVPGVDTPRPDADAPAKFVSEGPVYPIVAQRTAPNSEVAPATTKASVYSPAREVGNAGFETAIAPNGVEAAASSAPATEATPRDWQQLVAAAADDLGHKVADSPATTAEVHQHVSLRILRLLAGQTESALEPIPHISPVEQDYWSRQLFALATYLDHHGQPDDKRRAAASVTHLDEAVANLRELGALTLWNLTFCKSVYGYGAVEPFKEDRFSPGEQVQLYVEVENYHSESTEKGFTTSLGSTYELLDEKGERVDGGEFPTVDDCCRSRRRDFHIQFGLTLPEKIAAGRYQFQLVVRDRQSDKIAHAKASFEIREKGVYSPK